MAGDTTAGKVTKTHAYLDVAAVYLKGIDRFIISYFNDHEFIYVTTSAPLVVSEINRRVAACQNLVRHANGVNFTPKSLEDAAKVSGWLGST